MKKIYFILGIAFLWVTILAGKTWRVPSEVPTIKSAVEDSAQYDDTVLVAPGIYDTTSGEAFPINMKNGVVLISKKGRDSTIIDANAYYRRVLSCTDVDTAVICGFTIKGGESSTTGAGIYCSNSHLIIIHNMITNNSGKNTSSMGPLGGGIYCFNSHLSVTHNIITNNSVGGGLPAGGGIYAKSSSVVIENNIITHNGSLVHYCTGGGISCESCPFVLIKNNIIAHNVVECFGYGGGICASSCSLIIEDNIIANNTSPHNGVGGGIKTTNVAGIVRNNIIVNNSALYSGGYNSLGGGIHCTYVDYEGAPLSIEYNLIANNFAKKGGGIMCWFLNSIPDSCLRIRFNAIIDNSSGIWGDSGTADTNHIYYNLYVSDSSMQDTLYPGIPGEPSTVNSIKIYENSTYTNELSVADIGDTFWIELKGLDWNNLTIDPAVVIITSQKDSYGIAVVLIETDTASGVYQGFARVNTLSDDMWNKIGANSGDTIIVCANVDHTKCDTVIVEEAGVEETQSSKLKTQSLKVYPNPFNQRTVIRYSLFVIRDDYTSNDLRLTIHDISGRLIREFPINDSQLTTHEVTWDGRDKSGKKVSSGIYFCVLETPDFKQIKKLVIFK